MTANKIKKKDLDAIFNKIDANNINKENLYAIKQIVENEVKVSIRTEGVDKYISERNYVCFYNVMRNLENNNIKDAWWELTDIISFHRVDDYLSIDEVVLVDIALTLILNKL